MSLLDSSGPGNWIDTIVLNGSTLTDESYLLYFNRLSLPIISIHSITTTTTTTSTTTPTTTTEWETSTTSTGNKWRYPTSWTIILCIAYSLVFILGLFGNGAVLYVIFSMRHGTSYSSAMFGSSNNNVFNYLICNLAIADLLVIIFCLLPNLLSSILTDWIMGRIVCKLVPYLQGVSVSASVYTLVAIAIDRFYGIYYPFHNGFSPCVRRILIGLIWLLSLTITLPWLIYFDIYRFDINNENNFDEIDELDDDHTIITCQEVWSEERAGNIYFLIVNCGFQYLLPVSIIIFFYVLLYVRISNRKIPMTTVQASIPNRRTSSTDKINIRIMEKSKLKVLKMLIIIVSLFVLSWLPLYVIFILIKFSHIDENSTSGKLIIGLTPLAQWLGASNSCVNPILYFFFNPRFRAYMHRNVIWKCSRCLHLKFHKSKFENFNSTTNAHHINQLYNNNTNSQNYHQNRRNNRLIITPNISSFNGDGGCGGGGKNQRSNYLTVFTPHVSNASIITDPEIINNNGSKNSRKFLNVDCDGRSFKFVSGSSQRSVIVKFGDDDDDSDRVPNKQIITANNNSENSGDTARTGCESSNLVSASPEFRTRQLQNVIIVIGKSYNDEDDHDDDDDDVRWQNLGLNNKKDFDTDKPPPPPPPSSSSSSEINRETSV